MWNKNSLTKILGIEYPIIQGPFGGGLSSIELLSIVSNMGGMGSFGAHYMAPEDIRTLVSDIRKTTDKPFAINLWISDHDPGGLDMNPKAFEANLMHFEPFYKALNLEPPSYSDKITERYEEQIEVLLDVAPPVFSFVFGIPSAEVLKECRKRHITTIGAATTLEEALAIEEAGVDIILATGFEAGGHRVSFMKPAENSLIGTFALIPQITQRVRIPVIAAGGISDARGIKAAQMLGAQGVQMGTAFLACNESGASAMHRQMILSEESRETVLSRAFTGRLARFIGNDFIRKIEATPNLPLPFPLQSFFTGPLKKAAAAQDNKDFASLYAGQGAAMLKHTKASELMHDLISSMEVLEN